MVIRVNKTKDYTVMSNSHFRDKRLSLKAKGLLSLMLSLPEDWDYTIAGLVTLSKDGKDSVTAALSELEEAGYLIRTRLTDDKGRFTGYDYDIYEEPQTEKPFPENPDTDNPDPGNPPQLNTKVLNTKESNTKNKERKKEGSFNAIIEAYTKDKEIADLLRDWLKNRKAKRAAMTDSAIQKNIDKLDKFAAESHMSVRVYLEEVVRRGWAAFFPINQPQFPPTPKKRGTPIITEEEYERQAQEPVMPF